MSVALESILGYVNLLGIIEQVKSGIPEVLPPAFQSLTTSTLADAGRYTLTYGQRKVAKRSEYGSPSRNRELKQLATKDVKLIHEFEDITLKPQILQQLRSFDSYELNRGKEFVALQVKEFTQLFYNARIASEISMLFNGKVWYDGDGNFLPSSSGAVVTVDYGVQASHQNQLALLPGPANIISASWATAGTDIPKQLRILKKQSKIDTGYELKNAYYGANIPSYLTANNYVHDYLSRNYPLAAPYLTDNEIPDGLFGFHWIPAYEAFFEDQNSVNQSLINDDAVTFSPEVDKEWYELLEGSYMVPTTINILTDAMSALNNCKQVQGMFAYGILIHNPVTIQMFYGDTFLPALKNPDTVYQAICAGF